MVNHAWVVSGAVAIGVAIASVLGGGVSPWGAVAVLATFAIALVTTVAFRRNREPVVASYAGVARRHHHHEQEGFDNDLLARVHGIVSDRTIDWLGVQDFSSTWRDAPLAPLRELRRVDSAATTRFGDDLEDAIADLYVAAGAFLDFYDLNTRPDSLVVGSEWRELRPHVGTGASTKVETLDVVRGVQAQLAERAAAVVHAWDVLTTIEARAQRRGVLGRGVPVGVPGQRAADQERDRGRRN